jgi:hypothetical protein
MQGGVDVWSDVGNGVVKSLVFGVAVTFIAVLQGYEAQATPEGVSAGNDAHRGGGVAGGTRAGLRPDRHDVQHLRREPGAAFQK